MFFASVVSAGPGSRDVEPVYDRKGNYVEEIVQAALRQRVQLVHFQHAGDLLGFDQRLPETMQRLRAEGIRTVVTLHTVYGPRKWRALLGEWSNRRFHLELAAAADRIVVHHRRGMADSLVAQGVAEEKLEVIPHGTSVMELPERDPSLHRLGLPEDSFVFLFFGFIHVQKNVHTVLRAFLRVAADHPRACLLVAGMPWDGRWYNRGYLALMKARVRAAGLGRRVLFNDRFIASEDVPAHFSAADVVLLPHWQRYGSASGVFHQALGAGKPMIIAKGPKFEDGMRRLADLPELLAAPGMSNQWAHAMTRLMDDEKLRLEAGHALSSYATQTAWNQVAGMHLRLYSSLLAKQ